MAQWAFLEWLLLWLLEVETFDFEWDSGNSSKNAQKHKVVIREIEEVFALRTAMPLGRQVFPEVGEERLGVVGPTRDGRLLMVAFTLRKGKIRPISARPAHKKERASYEKYLRQILERV